LEKKLGIGSADGAGEAWKVGPAYAALSFSCGVMMLDWEDVCRWPLLLGAGDGRLAGGFFADRGAFFFDEVTGFDESVVAPPGLTFRGGDDGGVLSMTDF
jgi:hypothetical protein